MARLHINSKIWIHIFAWAAFIGYEVPIAKLWDTTSGLDEYICYYILDVLLFYFNAAIVSRYAGKWVTVLQSLILELCLFFALSLAVGVIIFKIHNHWTAYNITEKDCARAVWRGIYIMGLSGGYGFFKRAVNAANEKNAMTVLQLETENQRNAIEKNFIKAQNAYLKSQINRHLLYNTLNFIYDAVFRIAPKAGQSVMLLAEIMRYALAERPDGKVSLGEEIEQIGLYIRLNELRYDYRLGISFKTELDADCDKVGIPPLLFLTFIENIFKHGDLKNYADDAQIFIRCKEHTLHFVTSNYKKGYDHPSMQQIGITNARIRLNSFYGADNYMLNLMEQGNKYFVDLMIRL